MADLLDRVLQRVAAEVPELSGDRLLRIQVDVRNDLAGSIGQIGSRPALRHELALSQQLSAGVAISQAFKAAGISRSTGYRILSKPARSQR